MRPPRAPGPGLEWVWMFDSWVELERWFVRKVSWMARATAEQVQAQLYLRSRGERSMLDRAYWERNP